MKLQIVSILFLCAFFIQSCVLYPSLCDIPLIERKDDAVITGGITSTSPPPIYSPMANLFNIGANASVAYGLTDHIAIQSHAYIHTSMMLITAAFLQQSVGYYTKFGENILFENYYGTALGYGSEYTSDNDNYIAGKYYNLYTQINIGKYFDEKQITCAGIGLKFTYLNGKFQENTRDTKYEYERVYISRDFNTQGFLYSPLLFVRIGQKQLSFNILAQYQYTPIKTVSSLPINYGVSLQYRPRRIHTYYNAYEVKKQRIESYKNPKENRTYKQLFDYPNSMISIHTETIDKSDESYLNNLNRNDYFSLPVQLKYDISLDTWFTMSMSFKYKKHKGTYWGRTNETYNPYSINVVNITARPLCVFQNFKKMKLYFGFGLGYNFYTGTIANSSIQEQNFSPYTFEFIPIGMYYNVYKGFFINSETIIREPFSQSFGVGYMF